MKKKLLSLILLLSIGMGTFTATGCNGLGTPNSSQNASIEESLENADGSESTFSSENSGGSSVEDFGCTDGSAHEDNDGNGSCDICMETVAFTFDIFAINDLHGKFEDTKVQPGVDELSTYFAQTKEKNENTIILSSGDMWQGSPESNITKGTIITDWMNAMGFVSMTLGNHEYDWGAEYIKKNQAIANFPFLAINVYDNFTNERVDYCQPSVMVAQNGVKIGIIGAIGDCQSSISAEYVRDVSFKVGAELTNLVMEESNKLREEGADFIVYSIHDGNNAYDQRLSAEGYVDLVFEGHTHQAYGTIDDYGVYHLQNGGDNGGVSHAQVNINYVTGDTTVLKAGYEATSKYASYDDHPIVDELMGKYKDEVAIAYEVLGQNDKTRESYEILNACAKLYYEAGVKKWSDKDVILGGAYMQLRAPYKLQAGTIIYGDLMNILPFDNRIVLCGIRGSDLRNTFFSNKKNYYVYCREDFDVNDIEDTSVYYVITDSYTSQFKPNNLIELETYNTTTFPRDLYAQYVREGNLTSDFSNITLTSIPEIIAIGQALAAGSKTEETYFVKGTIISIDNAYYGNMTIVDENANQLYVYGTKDKNGNFYSTTGNALNIGDTLLLEGPVLHYQGSQSSKIELEHAIVWQVN